MALSRLAFAFCLAATCNAQQDDAYIHTLNAFQEPVPTNNIGCKGNTSTLDDFKTACSANKFCAGFSFKEGSGGCLKHCSAKFVWANGTSSDGYTKSSGTSCPSVTGNYLKVLPLGDSITQWMCGDLEFPVHPDHWSIGGYRGPLFQKLQQAAQSGILPPSIPVGSMYDCGTHEGHSGFQCNGLYELAAASVERYQPDVVMLMCGTNDMYFAPAWERGEETSQRSWNMTDIVLSSERVDIDKQIIESGTAVIDSPASYTDTDDPVISEVVDRMNTLLDRIYNTSKGKTTVLLSTVTHVNQTRCLHYYYGACPSNMLARIMAFNKVLPDKVVQYQNQKTSKPWVLLHDINAEVNGGKGFEADDFYTYGIHFSLQGFGKIADQWYNAVTGWWKGRTEEISMV